MEALSRASPCDSLPPPEAPGGWIQRSPGELKAAARPEPERSRGGVSRSTSPEEGGGEQEGRAGGRSCNREGLCKES